MTTPLLTDRPLLADPPTPGRPEIAPPRAGPAARTPVERYVWAITRIGLGFVFLWAFADKLLGLGRATPAAGAWIDGGNPTKGYLSSATGPLHGLFQSMAGGWLVNVLFMGGLLAVGLALMLGVARILATVGGVLLVVLMWLSHLPPETNPFLDDHLIYALVLVGLLAAGADRTLGLGDRWSRLAVVRRVPLLR